MINKVMDLYTLVDIDKDEINRTICKNMRESRTVNYEKFKLKHPHEENPYSVDNIASVLNISKVHYKRLENYNDKSKNITLYRLIMLSKIYNKKLDDFLK